MKKKARSIFVFIISFAVLFAMSPLIAGSDAKAETADGTLKVAGKTLLENGAYHASNLDGKYYGGSYSYNREGNCLYLFDYGKNLSDVKAGSGITAHDMGSFTIKIFGNDGSIWPEKGKCGIDFTGEELKIMAVGDMYIKTDSAPDINTESASEVIVNGGGMLQMTSDYGKADRSKEECSAGINCDTSLHIDEGTSFVDTVFSAGKGDFCAIRSTGSVESEGSEIDADAVGGTNAYGIRAQGLQAVGDCSIDCSGDDASGISRAIDVPDAQVYMDDGLKASGNDPGKYIESGYSNQDMLTIAYPYPIVTKHLGDVTYAKNAKASTASVTIKDMAMMPAATYKWHIWKGLKKVIVSKKASYTPPTSKIGSTVYFMYVQYGNFGRATEEDLQVNVVPKKGSTFSYKGIKYKTTKVTSKGATAALISVKNRSAKKLTVPAKAKIKGAELSVTSIGKGAFRNMRSLRHIEIKAKGLRSIGKNAFLGVNPGAKIYCPKSKLSKYRSMLRKSGISPSIRIM